MAQRDNAPRVTLDKIMRYLCIKVVQTHLLSQEAEVVAVAVAVAVVGCLLLVACESQSSRKLTQLEVCLAGSIETH